MGNTPMYFCIIMYKFTLNSPLNNMDEDGNITNSVPTAGITWKGVNPLLEKRTGVRDISEVLGSDLPSDQ